MVLKSKLCGNRDNGVKLSGALLRSHGSNETWRRVNEARKEVWLGRQR